MIKRAFRFENFRTLGISDPLELELGACSEKDKSIGGVLLLVGQNNAGKSNIISAIKAFSEIKAARDQKPRYLLDKTIVPQVKYVLKDGELAFFAKVNNKGSYDIEASKDTEKIIFEQDDKEEAIYKISNDTVAAQFAQMVNFAKIKIDNPSARYNRTKDLSLDPLIDGFIVTLSKIETSQEITNDELKNIANQMREIPLIHLTNAFNNPFGHPVPNVGIVYNDLVKKDSVVDKKTIISKYFEENYKMSLVPNITLYDDKNGFSTKHLITNVVNGKIQTPLFFEKMFNLLENTNYKNVEEAYETFYSGGQQDKGTLYTIKKILEKDLVKLSNQFNKIYTGVTSGQYSFDVDFESGRIDFIVLENGKPVFYDDQSSGFKWFFDFFFNLIGDLSMKPGSIVLMDEPATNLHVVGQVELRKLIKKFAIENNVLFIISTHSPFFVDIDHLDELRVVRKEERESFIDNKFTHLDGDDIDTLLPVYSALTVGKHILLNPNSTLIFVEGISDYNYLVAFKAILGVEDISFLPIQGVGKAEQQEKIFKKLLKITPSPIVLVDGDWAGKEFKNNNKYKAIEIISLKEIDESFKTIETVFDKEDLTKNPLIANKVEPYLSSIEFKNDVEYNKKHLSKKTINNFLSLFKHLSM
ncbi:MAG: AAA family ATPase [Firmicutes bacterium]|nr:AAA family ATPase [Bacillota bacterium]